MDRSAYFSVLLTKNCRKYIKFCYQLRQNVDEDLLNRLRKFGFTEIYSFSKFMDNVHDTFRILVEDDFQISGVINGDVIHIALAKEGKLRMKNNLENELIDWMVHKENKFNS